MICSMFSALNSAKLFYIYVICSIEHQIPSKPTMVAFYFFIIWPNFYFAIRFVFIFFSFVSFNPRCLPSHNPNIFQFFCYVHISFHFLSLNSTHFDRVNCMEKLWNIYILNGYLFVGGPILSFSKLKKNPCYWYQATSVA